MFRKIKYKRYQKWFCKQYLKRSNTLPNYDLFLKRYSKTDSLPSSFCNVALFDVIDNNGMNKLIKSIYKLKSHKKIYSVNTPYLYNRFRKLNYINSNLNGNISGVIAEIKFKSSSWFHSININYTYINSSQCLIQYTFKFNNVISTNTQIHNFVLSQIKEIKKEPYFHSYANKKIIKTLDYKELLELDHIFFADILQGYICDLFYTEYGKHYKLPIEYCLRLHKYNNKKRNKLRNPFLCESYENGRNHMIISTLNYDRFELSLYNAGKYLPSPTLLRYCSTFSTEIYYMAFFHIETEELEKKMRKYLNSRKYFISSKDIKWLINKIRYIKEQKPKIEKVINNKGDTYYSDYFQWKSYYRGKVEEHGFINYPKYTDYFLNQYEQNLEYLNSIASVQNNLVVIIVAVATLIATLVGIIITLLK